MGGKRKLLTQTRRKALAKEMMDAVMAGTFSLNNQPLEAVLDEVDVGIKEDRYPIEVDLAGLMAIWSGSPAPATAPEPEQPVPPNYGTVDQIQNGHVPEQIRVHSGGQVDGIPAEQWQAQQAAAGYGPTPQQAAEMGIAGPVVQSVQTSAHGHINQDPQYLAWLATQPAQGGPSPLPAAVGVAPGQAVPTALGPQTVQQPAAAMTLQQAQAAMEQVGTMEVGEPPKEQPVDLDITPVAEWLELARSAKAKMEAAKDILETAKAQIGGYLDQQGGPDKSKVGFLNGRPVLRRTYVRKKVLNADSIFESHPELDRSAFTDISSFYKTELLP
jgi:hypothetical protein